MDISVIGAGVGGLAAALRVLSRGHDCTIYERQDQIGGRARVFQTENYTFDAGPTIITAPFLFEELFELFDESLDDYVNLLRLDPWYRIRFEDGRTLPFVDSKKRMIDELRSFSTADANRYKQYLNNTKAVFDVAFKELGDQPFNSVLSMIKVIPDLLRHDALSSVYGKVDNYFRNEHIKKALSFHPLLIGGNPLKTTSIYRMIHYLEREWGVHYVQGGTNQLISSLGRLFEENGGEIQLNTTVSDILVEDKSIKGFRTEEGLEISTDLLISNVDPAQLYANMLPEDSRGYWNSDRVDQLDYSMGLFVLFFGVNRSYDHLEHHEILLTQDYSKVLTDIFEEKKLPDNLNLYLHRPTANDSALAPDGHDAMYALVPVPNLNGNQNWSELGPEFRDRVVKTIENRVCPNLTESITEIFYMTPEDFQHDYLSKNGAGFSIQPKLTQSAWFRFHNKSHVDNLYLVGAGTHPGAGLPGVLCTAKAMENSLSDDV